MQDKPETYILLLEMHLLESLLPILDLAARQGCLLTC